MKLTRLRSTILFLIIFLISSLSVFAEENALPAIDAQRFSVTPIQKSTSGKIYLFESGQVIPKTGNLILVYDHDKPAMAFRILKNDPAKRQFVGKRVRRYDETSELTMKQEYSTLEKVADILPPPVADTGTTAVAAGSAATSTTSSDGTASTAAVPSPTPEPVNPEAQDTELDSGSTATLDKLDESYSEEEDEEEDVSLKEVEEGHRLDPFNNILSVSAGYFANASNFSGDSVLNNGFSLSYGHVIFNDVFISKRNTQDSLAIELGGIYYRIINKDGGNDIYSMLPFYGNLLYQLHFSSTFSLNIYGGLQYNYMTSASNPGRSLSSLQGVQPNVGLGTFYTLGPQWYLRADIGWDRISGGLCIKW